MGRLPYLGHAGIVLINNKTGGTRYYECGRYETAQGEVRRVKIPNVTMGKDGLPTKDSMNKLLEAISRQSGQGGPVEGAYFKNDKTAEMVKSAEDRMTKNNDPSREGYSITGNNNSYIDELQGSADAVYRYRPGR